MTETLLGHPGRGGYLWDGSCCSFRTKIFKKACELQGSKGETGIENRHGHGRRESNVGRTGPCVKQIEWERAVRLGELRLQAGAEEAGGREGGDVGVPVADSC